MSSINRYLPLILVLSIIFNVGCVLVFRIRLDRRYLQRFNDFSESTKRMILDMSADSMSRIDSYFVSNYVHFSSVSSNDFSCSDSTPLFNTVLDWDYDFCVVGGSPFAVRGVSYYTLGDRFPRGGVITSITEDSIVLDDLYLVINSKKHNKLGDIKNELRYDKMRK